ncbi:hypothetical protein [Falsiroseomonas tokyonensis]|uniref:Uncharacterized protein n=1 Tax=Falsiroseomonas tokyonensis TaxID=430521 RepID=A0ABV7BWD8_9PROT|nr:hypothetical protein [Falsiroseomonas tokyonensis]MBU8539853.1 hypothetical protein [Falsiroseomonas tokyonensis]
MLSESPFRRRPPAVAPRPRLRRGLFALTLAMLLLLGPSCCQFGRCTAPAPGACRLEDGARNPGRGSPFATDHPED